MYNIYDIEIDKQILSSLSFIALESGITFNNKLQFNNIMYKLYHYLESDINFSNGITITEELKSKINDFKKIYLELPDPNIEDGYKHLFTINSNDNAGTKFVDMEKIESTIGETYEFPYFFVPEGTGSNLYYKFSVFRSSDGYERFIGSSTAIPANTAYFKLALEAQNSRYVAYIKFYNSEEELISTISYNGSTSYNPPDYTTFKINYLYHSNKIIECYNYLKNDFTIDENNLVNLNTDILNNGDVYYSDAIGFGKDKEEITINHLLNKTLNGEEFGFKYGTIQTHLNKICKFDGNVFKFLTITANEDETSYTGYVSTYPLYATNVNGKLGLWFLNIYDKTPVKVFKSTNGSVWEEIKSNISSALPYNTDAIIVTSTALSYAGEDIVYSNYPVFYSLSGTNFEDKVSTTALESDNTFKLYRNSDEDFTLDRMPLGASFYFGKHKIEDSPRFSLVFRAMDYTNNINTAQKNDNWLPKDSVYCETPHLIDKLSFHNYKNNSSVNIMYENSHLPRWLNSDAPYGEWWEKINDDDSPSTPENMYNNSVSLGFEFGHRAGFLYHFHPKEIALLQPFNGWNVYKGLKVLLLDKSETPDSSSRAYRPKIYKACGSSTVGILRPYFVKEMKYHRHADSAKMCSTQLNDFVCTYSDSFFWCRNKGTNNGQYSDLSSNGNPAYYGRAVRPVVCIDKDTKVIREPDEYGIFKLDLGIEETIDVRVDYETEIKTTNSFEVFKDTKIAVLNNFKNIFETFKATGVSFENIFDTFIEIRNSINKKYNVVKHNVTNFVKVFETSRMHNYIHTLSFPTKVNILANFEKAYVTERNTNEEYQVSVKYETERRTLNSFIERFNTSLTVLGVFEKSYQLHRFVRAKKEVVYETQIDTIEHREFDYPLQRFTLQNKTDNAPTRIRVTNNFESVFETKRDTHVRNDYFFPAERKIQEPFEVVNENLVRFVEGKSESIYPTFRYMSEPTVIRYNCVRNITERHAPKYPTTRQIIRHLQALEIYPTNRYVMVNSKHNYPLLRKTIANVFDEVNLLRYVVQNIDFVANCERYILENTTDDYELCRSIIEDFEKINEAVIYTLSNAEEEYNSELRLTQIFNLDNPTLREVIDMIEVNYPTKRATTVTTNKYVSKDNLMLYTVLLKQEIATFIEQKIKYELDKRGL